MTRSFSLMKFVAMHNNLTKVWQALIWNGSGADEILHTQNQTIFFSSYMIFTIQHLFRSSILLLNGSSLLFTVLYKLLISVWGKNQCISTSIIKLTMLKTKKWHTKAILNILFVWKSVFALPQWLFGMERGGVGGMGWWKKQTKTEQDHWGKFKRGKQKQDQWKKIPSFALIFTAIQLSDNPTCKNVKTTHSHKSSNSDRSRAFLFSFSRYLHSVQFILHTSGVCRKGVSKR